jgi:hypothetical protein
MAAGRIARQPSNTRGAVAHMTGHPDYQPGDQIDLYEPPQHCGQTMQVFTAQTSTSAYEVVCPEDDAEFRTDHNGNVIR